MKQLVKRMLRPYHLELGCVEAYKSKAPATSKSDTTKDVRYDISGTYKPKQDSMHVQNIKVENYIVNGDTISTHRDTSYIVITGKTVKEEKGWMGKRAWDGMVEWIFGEDEDT